MRNGNTKGFTLIELLIVIAIIGILAAVLIPNLLGARRAAVDRAGDAYMRNVYTAAQAYLAENVEETEVDTNCETGYDPDVDDGGTYEVDEWGPIATCAVEDDGSGVGASWAGGNVNEGTVGEGTIPTP